MAKRKKSKVLQKFVRICGICDTPVEQKGPLTSEYCKDCLDGLNAMDPRVADVLLKMFKGIKSSLWTIQLWCLKRNH